MSSMISGQWFRINSLHCFNKCGWTRIEQAILPRLFLTTKFMMDLKQYVVMIVEMIHASVFAPMKEDIVPSILIT